MVARVAKPPRPRCQQCKRVFDWAGRGRRPKFCSAACRNRSHRAGKARAANVVSLHTGKGQSGKSTGSRSPGPTFEEPATPTYDATLAELTEANRQTTSVAHAALVLARRIDLSTGESGSGLKALVAEWRATMAEAVKSAGDVGDLVDELQRRRMGRGGRGA